MKKFKLGMSAVATLFLFSVSAMASNLIDKTENGSLPEAQNQIKNQISFPNIILQTNRAEKIEVLFTTNDSGKVNFVLAKTGNQEIKKEVEKQFMELFLPSLKTNVTHSITLTLKTI